MSQHGPSYGSLITYGRKGSGGMTIVTRIRGVARLGFWITFLAVLLLTLSPRSPPPLFLSDKAAHGLAFFALSLTGVVAWGRRRLIVLFVGLAAAGAAIELLQATPFVARDAELFDWVADITGVAAGYAFLFLLSAARGSVRRRSKPDRDETPDRLQ